MSYLDKFHEVNGIVDIKPRNFYEFFSQKSIYQIPIYQRPYSWGKKEVNELLNDIKKAIFNDEDWFLGPIFTASDDHDASHNRKVINLLDGQQRITTLVIISRVIFTLQHFKDGFDFNLLGSLPEFQDSNGNPRVQLISDLNTRVTRNIEYLKKDILILNEYGFPDTPKFLTDTSCREVFKDWIIDLKGITDSTTYNAKRDIDTSGNNEYQLTKKKLNKNISLIYDYFEGVLDNGLDEAGYAGPAKGLVFLDKFLKHLLEKNYFIHIPLKEQNDVLDIFESINNRGKKLNLSDNLRFITVKSFIDDPVKQKNVNIEWSKLYKNVQKWDVFFKDSDSFLERYINSIANTANGYTNDHDRLDRFRESHSNNFLNGMKKVNHVLDMVDYIFNDRRFKKDLTSKAASGEDAKFSSLKILLKEVLKISENSQVLFLGFFNKIHDEAMHKLMQNSPDLQGHLNILIFLWDFIKYVIATEIYSNLQSNRIRPKFFSLVQSLGSNGSTCAIYKPTATAIDGPTHKFLQEKQKMNGLSTAHIKNLSFQSFTGSSKSKTTILLYYFQLLHKRTELNTSSMIEFKNCDHIVPQKWFNQPCWKEELAKEWKMDANEKRYFWKDLDLTVSYQRLIKDYIEELWDDKSSVESFIQLIGNKMYIYNKANIIKSNKCWNDEGGNKGAKSILTEHFDANPNTSYIIPTYSQPHLENNFGLTNIVLRTSFILKTICEKSDTEWGAL